MVVHIKYGSVNVREKVKRLFSRLVFQKFERPKWKSEEVVSRAEVEK